MMTLDDSDEARTAYTDKVKAALLALENDPSSFYVQSFVIAAYGEPVQLFRWSGEDGEHVEEPMGHVHHDVFSEYELANMARWTKDDLLATAAATEAEADRMEAHVDDPIVTTVFKGTSFEVEREETRPVDDETRQGRLYVADAFRRRAQAMKDMAGKRD